MKQRRRCQPHRLRKDLLWAFRRLNLLSDNHSEQDLFIDIEGMSCAACASAVQRAILNVEGVIQSEVNFAAESAWVAGRFDQGAVISAVRAAGYSATEAAGDPASKAQNQAQLFRRAMTQATTGLVLGSLMMLNMWMEWFSLTESIWMGALAAMATLGASVLPVRIFIKRRGRRSSMVGQRWIRWSHSVLDSLAIFVQCLNLGDESSLSASVL